MVDFAQSPITVSADPIRIAQVLRNLVENAVRYTSFGHVQVRVEHFVIRQSATGSMASASDIRGAEAPVAPVVGMVRFVVHDTGPGLPPPASDRLKSAAVPFASSSDGTGIGLFVVRDVLQQLGGSVDVRTRDAAHPEGRGTTFTVSIPALQVQDAACRVARDESSKTLHVLVVDDLSDVRRSLGDVTRRLGHACKVDFDELVVLPCGHAGFLPRISVFVQYLSWLAQWHMTAPVIRVRPTRPHHDRSDHCASPSRTHLELAFVTSSAAQTRSPVRRRPDHRLSFIQVNAAPAIKASSSPAASSALMRSINQVAAPPNK